MYRSNDYYREIIFNKWFEKIVTHNKTMRDGKFCDTGVRITHAPFITTFNKVYRQNSRYYDTRKDCYADCMAVVWEGMIKFKIRNDSTWKAIAEMEDMDNYKKLIAYLKTYVVQNIKRMNQNTIETTRVSKENGKRKVTHIFYNIVPDSLNKVITFDNSMEEVEIVDTIKRSYWEERNNYKYNLFIEWAKENMEKILTKSQNDFLKLLQEANYSTFDNDYDKEMLESNKMYIKLKLDRICDKIISRYGEYKKYSQGGYIIQEIDAELKAYEKFNNILNNASCEEMNNQLSRTILNSLNNPYWERLLYEELSDESLKAIIKAYQNDVVVYEDNFKFYKNKVKIPAKTLYELSELIEQRIIKLNKWRSEEMYRLSTEAELRGVKCNLMHYEIQNNSKNVYLSVNAYGIMVQK